MDIKVYPVVPRLLKTRTVSMCCTNQISTLKTLYNVAYIIGTTSRPIAVKFCCADSEISVCI